MTDSQFLNWMADRLVNVYHESPNTDFVTRLREIADHPAFQPSWDSRDNSGCECLTGEDIKMGR